VVTINSPLLLLSCILLVIIVLRGVTMNKTIKSKANILNA